MIKYLKRIVKRWFRKNNGQEIRTDIKMGKNVQLINSCLLSKLKTLDFTDFCPIFWYNDCKDFDKNKSFFLQFSYRF